MISRDKIFAKMSMKRVFNVLQFDTDLHSHCLL